MAGLLPEKALPLLAAVNNHGDLSVKLSSLKQVKDIILSSDPYLAVDLFPYLVDLQSSPETLVRKYLLEVIEEIGLNGLAHSSILMSVVLTLLKDYNPFVAKQAIVTGTNIFCSVLEELSLQFHRHHTVEMWLDDSWMWMVKFKDAVHSLLFEDGSIGPKLLSVKFLEMYILLFTEDTNDSDKHVLEALGRHRRTFNISWLVGRHPVLDPAVLSADAKITFSLLMEMLQSASVPALLTISTINSVATIARKRPVHYSNALSALLDFNSNFRVSKGGHTASIQYSIRTALLGFLKCTHLMVMESREILLNALRAMNAGNAADHAIRQVEKRMRNNDRASRDAQSNKDGSLIKKRPLPTDNEDLSTSNDIDCERSRYLSNRASDKLNAVEQMIVVIGDLIGEGERGVASLEILISEIQPDMLADIVITNLKHLPRNPPPLTRLSNLSLNQSNDSTGASSVVRSVCSSSDMSTSIDHMSDSRRDPRRDPRRSAVPVGFNCQQ